MSSCDIGYYIVNTSNICIKCGIENCLSCSSESRCDVCESGYELD